MQRVLQKYGDLESSRQNLPGEARKLVVNPVRKHSVLLLIAAVWFSCVPRASAGTALAWGNCDYAVCDVSWWPTNTVTVSAGGWQSVGLLADGSVVACGSNVYGSGNSYPGTFVAIASGHEHNLALRADGTVAAWGWNLNGQCAVPADLSGVVAVAAGGLHSMALLRDRTVVSWGGSAATTPPPAGGDYGLALMPGGYVTGWGDNTYGQLRIPGGTNVVAVSAGWYHGVLLTGSSLPPARVATSDPVCRQGSFSLRVPTQNGKVHCLEYCEDLSDPVWSALPLVAGSGRSSNWRILQARACSAFTASGVGRSNAMPARDGAVFA